MSAPAIPEPLQSLPPELWRDLAEARAMLLRSGWPGALTLTLHMAPGRPLKWAVEVGPLGCPLTSSPE